MNKNKLYLNTASLIIIIGLVAYMIILNFQRRKALEGEINYTIGKITEYKTGPKSRIFIYHFEIDFDNIEGHFSINEHFRKKHDYKMKSFIGKKFLVRYSLKKPKFNEIFMDKPVPDYISNCKDCVWSDSPF